MIKWFYRMKWLYSHKMLILANFLKKFIRVVYACEIFPTCEIGKNVNFIHGGVGCVIHEKCKIANNVKIYQNVTLGGNGKEHQFEPGAPVIAEGAIIYAGACILGPVTIGENAIVGANAVVLKDVPDNCIAVGVPARVLNKSKEVI